MIKYVKPSLDTINPVKVKTQNSINPDSAPKYNPFSLCIFKVVYPAVKEPSADESIAKSCTMLCGIAPIFTNTKENKIKKTVQTSKPDKSPNNIDFSIKEELLLFFEDLSYLKA